MINSGKQYLVIALIFIFSIGILYWLKPADPIEPCGIILPVKNTLPATKPSDIQLFPQMQYGMQVLGTISVRERATSETLKKPFPKSVVDKARALAASVGANGMVLSAGRSVQNLETGPVWIAYGKAVHIDN